jgi:Putative auto-transporter adhesin, head GIN domain
MKYFHVILVISLSLTSCGEFSGVVINNSGNTYSGLISPNPVDKPFPNVDFNEIAVGGAIETTVEYGPAHQVTLTGDRDEMADISLVQRGSQIAIYYTNVKTNRYRMFANITTPELGNLILGGATKTRVSKFPELKALRLEVGGGSKLNLMGSCQNLTATIGGASELDGLDFPTEYVNAQVGGASKVKILVIKELQVTVGGASVVEYLGNPVLKTSISGSSTVKKI